MFASESRIGIYEKGYRGLPIGLGMCTQLRNDKIIFARIYRIYDSNTLRVY